jgi:hypothetical protein
VFIFEAPLVRSVERTGQPGCRLSSSPFRCGHEWVGYIADLPTGVGEILLVGDRGWNDVEYSEL